MAEKLKDAEDRFLESMFAAEPIADDGFSQRIVGQLRRRLWLRRLALPVAVAIGGAIAIKPAAQLFVAGSELLKVVPESVVELPVSWLPNVDGIAVAGSLLQTVVLGAVLLGLGFFGSRIITD